MKVFAWFFVAFAAVIFAGTPSHGRIVSQMYCWIPESEFPVICEWDDDEDYRRFPAIRPRQIAGLPCTGLEREPGCAVSRE